MSWAEHHQESERLAIAAELAARSGQLSMAFALYREASEAERRAFDDLDAEKVRTRGITAVSAVSLRYKASELAEAEAMALQYLAAKAMPEFATGELRTVLQTIWGQVEIERSGLKFSRNDVLVSVRGGDVITGGAPLDLILRKVEEIRALFYRTVELLMSRPFRVRGGPSFEIQELFRPWLFQAPTGSYQFAVRLESPQQMEFAWPEGEQIPAIEAVTQKFLEIVSSAVAEPELLLPEIVPDEKYRDAFLKITRNLAPTGRSYAELSIRSAASPASPPIILAPATREAIATVIKKSRPSAPAEEVEENLRGILRAVHLDRDWLEVTVLREGREEHIKVEKAGEVIDDVVGPMMNRPVVVQTIHTPAGKFLFRDIFAMDDRPEEF